MRLRSVAGVRARRGDRRALYQDLGLLTVIVAAAQLVAVVLLVTVLRRSWRANRPPRARRTGD